MTPKVSASMPDSVSDSGSSSVSDAELITAWRAAWPEALAAWSKFTRLRDARLCTSRVDAAQEGLSGSFAMIRLLDQSVVIDLESVRRLGLQDYALEILAHEIGHHVLAPGSLNDQFRLLARIRRALPTLERHAAMVANLYTDLHINDRLQRDAGLRMADIYRILEQGRKPAPPQTAQPGQVLDQAPDQPPERRSRVWLLYMRIYENLWQLDKGSLGGGADDADTALDGDAWLGARLIRVYARDWIDGAGRFASLLLTYLVGDDERDEEAFRHLFDTRTAAQGCEPSGAQAIEADELSGAIHPIHDSRISGQDEDEDDADQAPADTDSVGHAPADPEHDNSGGQLREPYEYGELLKAAGIALSDHDIAVRYYRERALPHLVPFPVQPAPVSAELQMEALEPWDIGDPLDEIDWLHSVIASPRPIPGITTLRRSYGPEPGRQPVRQPIDLDMYVDSSGSMPNPQRSTSYLALAGAIIALSALRAGAKVQVTLWAGKGELMDTRGFVRDEDAILRTLTGFLGGGTCFPVHQLRRTYCGDQPRPRPTHILMISDAGITTMFDKDERGVSGWEVSASAMALAGAGGTMALDISTSWNDGKSHAWMNGTYDNLRRAQREQGWDIHAIARFEDLLEFARRFSRRHYATVKGAR